ncbi:MAG TPA: hypothetical protein VFT87_00885 [Candidatus Saccharimonadales bacterium]|nr:hypothetical protein [Candidatus Saccharimonadales bacterium]
MQQDLLVWASVAMLGIATCFQWRKIVRGTKPAKPIGWLIWSGVSLVTLAALIKAGATPLQLFIPSSQFVSTAVLLVAAMLRHKDWRNPEHLIPSLWEKGAIICCVGGLGIWVIFGLEHPIIAIIGNGVANFAGLLPMLLDAWEAPETTTPAYWAFRGISCIFSALAFTTERFNLVGLLPQTVGLVIAGSMLTVYLIRQKRRLALVELRY